MKTLPQVMVAPNGARRQATDHPALPIHLADIVATARACHQAGADGLHLHLRDADGGHVLDAGLYREALAELAQAVPGMAVQVTTEAVGRYSPAEQRELVEQLEPAMVSISVGEMLAQADYPRAVRFYRGCEQRQIAVQHIIYGPDDLERLAALAAHSAFDDGPLQLLFVLGRYQAQQQSDPAQLQPFLQWLSVQSQVHDWAVCAFGRQETHCLLAAHRAGGKVRVGFENSLWHADGRIAEDNAARVREVVTAIHDTAGAQGERPATDTGISAA